MSSDDVGAAENADEGPDEAALAVRDTALEGVDGTPTCTICPADADFYLHEAGRISTFVCWEHVSPYAAAVNGTPEDADRPIAVPLPSFR
ncbi:hypothetical protein [Halarchaeum salinum]|uniref:Uncharacterized protein n=1 Tax=Halarchaeum salinum TaxID=489912 RepID=A0AAV3SA60_9EURY